MLWSVGHTSLGLLSPEFFNPWSAPVPKVHRSLGCSAPWGAPSPRCFDPWAALLSGVHQSQGRSGTGWGCRNQVGLMVLMPHWLFTYLSALFCSPARLLHCLLPFFTGCTLRRGCLTWCRVALLLVLHAAQDSPHSPPSPLASRFWCKCSVTHRSAHWRALMRHGGCCGCWRRRPCSQVAVRTPCWSGSWPTMAPRRGARKVRMGTNTAWMC